MFGMIVKIEVYPGKRDQMIAILKESAYGMPGCLSYVVATDDDDENALWVTEVWENAKSHDDSLALPSVKAAVPRARLVVTRLEKIAVTVPVFNGAAGAWPPTAST
jgi:quinol monooxygenase YgiN